MDYKLVDVSVPGVEKKRCWIVPACFFHLLAAQVQIISLAVDMHTNALCCVRHPK